MDAHADGTDTHWSDEVRIDDGIIRVRSGETVRWFIVPDASGATAEEEAALFPSTTVEVIDGDRGLLVPRCEGGLLDRALRERGGLAPALALGLLDEVVELLLSTPPAGERASRVTPRAFAFDARGAVTLLPGRTRDAAARTDAAELGEILHLALTGRTWEETGLPVGLTAPEVPVAVAALVTELLEDSVGALDLDALRVRIAALGPERDRGFRPAEPGVDEDSAPTATLGADLVRELRGAGRPETEAPARPRRAERTAARPPVRRPRARIRKQREEREQQKPRGQRTRPARWGRMSALALSVLGVCAGIVLLVQGVGGADVPNTRADAPDTRAEAPHDQQSAVGHEDPVEAVVELSRERADAIAEADRAALRGLTAPGSPAAAADAALALDECGGDCGDVRTLEVGDVQLLDPEEGVAD
ncbi:MAG TPA: hypothetical protein K8V08_04195, partial [Brevibacterium senegalense]|nr:hypothetical protein [Brevibacterium senegalense]